MTHQQLLSRRLLDIPPALSIYINQLVYDMRRIRRDVITLSLGEAYFDIPMFDFQKIDPNKGYHYSDSLGIPELRSKIAAYYEKYYGARVDPKTEIMISAGSKPIIHMCIAAVVNPDEEVLILEPAWLSYQEQVKLAGGTARFVPYDCPVADIPKHFSKKTRMLILNNPNNPAGRLYSREELETIYAAASKAGIWIMVDEAYSDFVVDERFVSLAEVVPDRAGVFVVNSLSKNMGMSGWRIGYVIANEEVIPELLKLNQHLITCAPSILQYYLATYFDDIIRTTLPQVRDVVLKRERIRNAMDRLGLRYMDGGCTFYFFVSLDTFPGSGMEFALQLLLDSGVAVVPGIAYGASTERFIRISIGTESEDRIFKALQMIRDLISVNHVDSEALEAKLAAHGIAPFQQTQSNNANE